MASSEHFLFGMGRPRLPNQRHLSRAWSQPQRVRAITGLAPAVQAQEAQGRYYVLVTQKSTSTQSKYTKGTSHMKTMETSQTSLLSPTSTSLSEDFLAKLSALLENGLDLTKPEGLYSLTSLGFSKTNDPDIFYLKTLKAYLVMTAAKLSRQSLGFSPTLGMTLNGRYLIQKTSVSPKTGNGCSLSGILEENVDEKYYLSAEQTEKILSQTKDGVQTFSRPSGRPITRAVITNQ